MGGVLPDQRTSMQPMGFLPAKSPGQDSSGFLQGLGQYMPGGLPTMPLQQQPQQAQMGPVPDPIETQIDMIGHWTGSPKTIMRDGYTYVRPDVDPGGTSSVPYTYDPELTQRRMGSMMAYQPNYSMFFNPRAMLQAGQPSYGSPWYSSMFSPYMFK